MNPLMPCTSKSVSGSNIPVSLFHTSSNPSERLAYFSASSRFPSAFATCEMVKSSKAYWNGGWVSVVMRMIGKVNPPPTCARLVGYPSPRNYSNPPGDILESAVWKGVNKIVAFTVTHHISSKYLLVFQLNPSSESLLPRRSAALYTKLPGRHQASPDAADICNRFNTK